MDPTRAMDNSQIPTCPVCRDLEPEKFTVQRKNKWDRLKSTIKWSDLELRKHTCSSCGLLFAVLSRFYSESHLQAQKEIELTHHHSICLRLGPRAKDELILYSLTASPWSSIQVRSHIHGSTSSEESLSWAKNLIFDCIKNHRACQPANISGHEKNGENPPKRLLDLGTDLSNNFKGPIKLYETESSNRYESLRYTCLSHTWGTNLPLVTSTGNIQQHLEKIAFSSLPKTFQDAVVFTRRLGIRYLWIDSLCIIQDDPEDWREQSAQMGRVYNNCAVCIAATLSTDSTSGCFSHRPLRIEKFVSSEGNPWEIFARNTLDHGSLSDPSGFRMLGPRQRDPLLSRGWVFQERLLAPRYLHFVEQEVALECCERYVCECACSCDRFRTGPSKAEIIAALSNGNHDKIEELWRALATKYSALSLTYATDRFPAIAGLANLFHTARGSHCLAGIWESSAVEDLAWAVWHPGCFSVPPMRVEGKQGNPSWSWASVDAPILYSHLGARQVEPLCEVVQQCRKWNIHRGESGVQQPGVLWYDIDRTDPEQVQSAQLLISGKLVPVTVTYQGQGTYCQLQHPNLNAPSWFSSDFAFARPGEHQIPSGETLQCLSLFQDKTQTTSLVLKAKDVQTGLYERVGLYTQNASDIEAGKQKNIFDGVEERRLVHII